MLNSTKMNTRIFSLLVATATGLAGQAQPPAGTPQSIPVEVVKTNSFKELLAGPKQPEDFRAWLAGMQAYKVETQALLKDKRGDLPDP